MANEELSDSIEHFKEKLEIVLYEKPANPFKIVDELD